jgi:hypothetical protein
VTADGRPRAFVFRKKLEILWINTGSLCNITSANCLIESSPRDDRLVYVNGDEVCGHLGEPMTRLTARLIDLTECFGRRLGIRVSADYYAKEMHEKERGPRTWGPMTEGPSWLSANGLNVSATVAERCICPIGAIAV